jgi:hypothetical protein
MAKPKKTKEVTCYLRVVTRNTCQEWYESASRDARRRAKEFRAQGYRVFVESMGEQVTDVGRVRMTLVSAMLEGKEPPAEPARIVRM